MVSTNNKYLRIEAGLKVRNTNREEKLFPLLPGSRIAYKALENGLADYVLDVTIPRTVDGKTVIPSIPSDWFACCGQTGAIVWKIQSFTDSITVQSPWCDLETWEVDETAIKLSGHGVLSRLQRRKLAYPTQQSRSLPCSSLVETIVRQHNIPFSVSQGVGVNQVPEKWVAGTDPAKNVIELLEASQCVLRCDSYGAILKKAPHVKTPDIYLTDGDDGTLVDVPVSFSKLEVPNHVIVRATGAPPGKETRSKDDGEIASEAVATGDFSPLTYGWISEEVTNDAIFNDAQAKAVAENILATKTRYARVARIQAVATWDLNLDTVVNVTTGETRLNGVVVGLEWVVDSPTMTIEVACGKQ